MQIVKKLYADEETTGTDPKKHGLTQFAAIVMKNGAIVDQIELKIQPFPTDEITQEALDTQHITREELFDVTRFTPRDAYLKIIQFLTKHVDKYDKKDKFHFVGYNGKFDADFLREFFVKNGDQYFGSLFWFPILDVACLSGYFLQSRRDQVENFKLRTLWEYLHPDDKDKYTDEDWHDAMHDIHRTIEIEDAMRQILKLQRAQLIS